MPINFFLLENDLWLNRNIAMLMFVTTLVFIFIIRLRFPSKVSIATIIDFKLGFLLKLFQNNFEKCNLDLIKCIHWTRNAGDSLYIFYGNQIKNNKFKTYLTPYRSEWPIVPFGQNSDIKIRKDYRIDFLWELSMSL